MNRNLFKNHTNCVAWVKAKEKRPLGYFPPGPFRFTSSNRIVSNLLLPKQSLRGGSNQRIR